MKITIDLTEAEVKGIKAYVKEIADDVADKNYIKQYITSMVSGVLHSPKESVSDYIRQFER